VAERGEIGWHVPVAPWPNESFLDNAGGGVYERGIPKPFPALKT